MRKLNNTLLVPLLLAGLTRLAFAMPFRYEAEIRPWSVVAGRDGNFYEATMNYGSLGGGTVYVICPTGKLRIISSFRRLRATPAFRPWGTVPEGSLSVGQDGAIYGSTGYGGAFGSGVLFKVQPNGRVSNLHHLRLGGHKNATLATRYGDLYTLGGNDSTLVRVPRTGPVTEIRMPESAISLVETAGGEIWVGTYFSLWPEQGGNIWRVTAEDKVEKVAEVGYTPHRLIPEKDGSVLCLTHTKVLRVTGTGEVTTLHEFSVPFEGDGPVALFLTPDGGYLGSTYGGGLEGNGTVFRLAPDSNAYSVLKHLPAPGASGKGAVWLEHVFPLREAAAAGVNLPPSAREDTVAADKLRKTADGQSLPEVIIGVLSNDSDADGDDLAVTEITAPSKGSAALDESRRKIVYSAASTPVENDSFFYTVNDGKGGTATARVAIRTSPTGKYVG